MEAETGPQSFLPADARKVGASKKGTQIETMNLLVAEWQRTLSTEVGRTWRSDPCRPAEF